MTLNTRLTTLRAACAFAACLLAAPAVLAQPVPPGGPGFEGPGFEQPDGHDDGPRGPGGPMERGVPPFLRGLDLSEAQQDRVFAILHAEVPKQRELEKAERKAAEALRELGRAPALDQAKAAASAQSLGQAIADQEMLRLQTGAELKAVLTPQQRAQLDQPSNIGRKGGRKDERKGAKAKQAEASK